MTQLRLLLIGGGIMAFAFALRTGTDWARWVAIGCLVGALGVRVFDKLRRRNEE
jgi:hypothetical protein